jgi:NDP-sugar pyrophosphorylase family protein
MDVMILAAGFGSRLEPLTKRLPKPLVACAGRRLIDWSFDLVDQAGADRVVINAHHLGDELQRRVAHRHGDRLTIDWVFEDEIRGTGGGIKGAAHLFSGTLLVANADILIELNVRDMKAEHIYTQAEATMAVHPARTEGYGVVRRDAEGRVRDLRGGVTRLEHGLSPSPVPGESLVPGVSPETKGEPYLFRGIHLLESSFIEAIPEDNFSCIVGQTYIPRIHQGSLVQGYETAGKWADAGTPERLFAAHELFWRFDAPVVEPGADIGLKSELVGRTQIAAGAQVGHSCYLEDVIVQPDAVVPARTSLRRAIVYGKRGQFWQMDD